VRKHAPTIGLVIGIISILGTMCGVAIQAGRATQRLDTVELKATTHDNQLSTIETNISKIHSDIAVVKAILERLEARGHAN